jgi:hypothetical protein
MNLKRPLLVLLSADLLLVCLQIALFKSATQNATVIFTVLFCLSLAIMGLITWLILTTRQLLALRILNGLILGAYICLWAYQIAQTATRPD